MLHGDDHAPILIFVVHMDLYYFATKYIHVQVTNAASCTRITFDMFKMQYYTKNVHIQESKQKLLYFISVVQMYTIDHWLKNDSSKFVNI